jgi:hypothetical protein
MKTERLAEIKRIHAKMRKDCKTWGTEDVYGDQLLAFDDLITEAEQLATLKQNLKGIEWVCDDGQQCPVCGGTWVHNVGHKPGCWLAATIGEGGGGEG